MGVKAVHHNCYGEATSMSLDTDRSGQNFSKCPSAACDPIMKPGIGTEQGGLENSALREAGHQLVIQETTVRDDYDAQSIVHQVADNLRQIVAQKGLTS
jgi:hypothetical protein